MKRVLPVCPQDSPRTPNACLAGLKAVLGVGLAAALVAAVAPNALADDLDNQQQQANQSVDAANASVAEASAELTNASAALVASRQALADARAVLEKAVAERDAAAAEEATKAAELSDAESRLAAAGDKVSQGQAAVEAQRSKAAADMRNAQQQNTTLISIGMLFSDSADAADVSSRIQWAQTVYNANSAELNNLTNLQLQLQTDQTSKAQLENTARLARVAAQQTLQRKQDAQAAADQAAATVDAQVQANAAAEAAASKALDQEKANLAARQAEAADVAARIKARNEERARQAAAAEAKRLADLAAQREREAAARQQAAAEAAARQQQAPAAPAAPAAPQQAPAAPAVQPAASSGGILGMPANGPTTSPFGWRTNPVLGYSELHDGLDIGAGCGTPIYAAESGRVAETYWSTGYGWRLMIDHGTINGQQVTTGYNHAQGYIVGVGDYVSRGQQIGYIGTTGLSTGCHLHFHVWVNGQVTDPAPFLFG